MSAIPGRPAPASPSAPVAGPGVAGSIPRVSAFRAAVAAASSARALGAGIAALLAFAAQPAAQERRIFEPLVPDARKASIEWRYATDDPGEGWAGPDYDDAGWSSGAGGFGAGEVPGAVAATPWATSAIWLRREFAFDPARYEDVRLSLHHDDDVAVYLNGVEVFTETGFTTGYTEFFLSEAGRAALRAGRNVLAVVCANMGGGPQYVDVGLSGSRSAQVAVLAPDARVAAGAWRYTTADPGIGWIEEGYDDAAWGAGPGGFGSAELYGERVGTAWLERDIWLRKSFVVDRDYPEYLLSLHHDDDLEVYLNGSLVTFRQGFTADYQEIVLPALEFKARVGTNLLAVRCTNTGTGPQFVDVGVLGLSPKGVPTALGRAAGSWAPARRAAVLFAPGGQADLATVTGGRAGRLELFRPGGTRAAVLPVASGRAATSLPGGLSAGLYRYRFTAPGHRAEGALVRLP